LREKAEAEGKEEAINFMKFETWCRTSKKALNKAISEEKEKIDSLTSQIESQTEQIASLDDDIIELTNEIGKIDAAQTNADNLRSEQNGVFIQADAVLNNTIAAVDECITVLKESMPGAFIAEKVRGVLSLVSTSITVEQRNLLSQAANDEPTAASHEKTYSFKGGNVIELLKQLKLKFEDDKVQVNKEETNALNAHALSSKARTNAKTAASKAKDDKTTLRSDVDAEKTTAESDKQTEETALGEDTDTLKTTTETCATRKDEWNTRSEVRNGEIEAIAVAVKILSKVGGVRTEPPGNPVPPPSPNFFLQVSSDASNPKVRAVNFLREQAKVLHARGLERLAQEISAHLGDPFGQVTNMIEKMIFRLMAEQKDEDDHKNWCDMELEKTSASISSKTAKVNELENKITKDRTTDSALADQIKEANEMIADIVAWMAEAADIRKIGKAENAKAEKDAKDAQTAIANAVAVLTDFYKSSGMVEKEAWEFAQRGVELPEEPSTWDSGYTGVANPSEQPGGIISVLEATASDFSKMEADTRAQEATDQERYEQDVSDNQIEKAGRTKEVEMKGNERKRLADNINAMEKQKKHTADELEATQIYENDLQPACVEGDSSYEDRKADRAKEIEALHRAQDILADAFKSSFLQRRK